MKRLFLIITVMLFIVLGLKTYSQYKEIEKTQEIVILNETRTLSKYIKAFRKTYQDIFTKNSIKIDKKTIELLPVKTADAISKKFSETLEGDIKIEYISDKPRNPKNKATKKEEKIMNDFKTNNKDEYFEKHNQTYSYYSPLKIEKRCLKCHGKKSEAFPIIQKRYNKAYDYKLGEIRGLLHIEIKERPFFSSLYTDYMTMVLTNAILYFIIILIIFILLEKVEIKEESIKNRLKNKIKEATRELREKQDFLDHQAHHDSLTGLPNRVLFNDRLEHSIERAKRNKKAIAVFFLDLDHFKEINDSLGHHIGDDVLISVAKRLVETIRAEDTLSRLGGDEFTIIMEDVKKIENTEILAEKILNALKKPLIVQGHELYITCSIGISIYPEDDLDKNNLLKFADAAMYSAKEEGRSNYKFYSKEMTNASLERIRIESEIRTAIAESELELYYQPQINSVTNELIGLEALIRWNHPEKGFLTPYSFMDIAEKTNLIIDVDNWVMRTGMRQIKKWKKKGYKPGKLALNLSVRQLMNMNFIEQLTKTMEEEEYSSDCLELEISENNIMNNMKIAVQKLKLLKAKNIEVSIDDFGRGYASLSYLKDLPIDRLKIDKSFIDGVSNDKKDQAIVKAIITLAKSLDLKIIAEGVEEKEQMEFLRENGCEEIQGYFYDKPLSAEELEKKYFLNK